MKRLCQRDLHWCSQILGNSKLTIGRFGCTTTCISMISDYFKCYMPPDAIAARIDWYTAEGLVLWNKIDIKGMKFVNRLYYDQPLKKVNTDAIDNAIKDKLQAVILEVNNNSHWVVAIRKSLLGKSYIVVDPWTGKDCDVIKTYKNITGAAFFYKKV